MEIATTKGMEAQKALSDWISDHGIKQIAISNATGIRKHRVSDILTLKSEIKASEMMVICLFIGKKTSDFMEPIEKEE